jgi:predicted Zn-dependent protease
MLLMLAAQSRLERGDAAAAAATLATAPGTGGSGGRAALLLGAQIALAAAMPAAGASGAASPEPAGPPGPAAVAELNRQAGALQTWVAHHPQDAAGWNLLARVWAALGHPLRAVRAEAEGRYVIGDLTGAVDRLRAGQRQAREGSQTDFIESSVIDARLRDIETERRREMAEREAQRGG